MSQEGDPAPRARPSRLNRQRAGDAAPAANKPPWLWIGVSALLLVAATVGITLAVVGTGSKNGGATTATGSGSGAGNGGAVASGANGSNGGNGATLSPTPPSSPVTPAVPAGGSGGPGAAAPKSNVPPLQEARDKLSAALNAFTPEAAQTLFQASAAAAKEALRAHPDSDGAKKLADAAAAGLISVDEIEASQACAAKAAYEEALGHARKAIDTSPDFLLAHDELGSALFDAERPGDGQRIFDELLKRNPNFAPAFASLGWQCMIQNKYLEAEHYYQQAFDAGFQTVKVLSSLGFLAAGNGHEEVALPMLKKAVEAGPTDADTWMQLGDAYEALKHYSPAADCYHHAAKLKPKGDAVWTEVAKLLRQANRLEEGIKALEEGIAANPDVLSLQSQMANLQLVAGRVAQAKAIYARLTEAHPEYAQGWAGAGILEFTTGEDLAAAQSAFENAHAAAPRNAELIVMIARCMAKQNHPVDADKCFAQALETDPKCANGWYYWGLLAQAQGDKEHAFERVRQALTLEPQNREFQKTQGEMLLAEDQGGGKTPAAPPAPSTPATPSTPSTPSTPGTPAAPVPPAKPDGQAAPGFDLKAADASPLDKAARDNDVDGVKNALDAGSLVDATNADGDTALHWAAAANSEKTLVYLILKGANVNAKNKVAATPLHVAALSGAAKAIDILIKNEANLEAADGDGATPLSIAAFANSDEGVRLLLNAGAKLESANQFGMTALHYAAMKNAVKTIPLLLAKGANLNAKMGDGATPYDFAVKSGCKEAAELLKAAAEKK